MSYGLDRNNINIIKKREFRSNRSISDEQNHLNQQKTTRPFLALFFLLIKQVIWGAKIDHSAKTCPWNQPYPLNQQFCFK